MTVMYDGSVFRARKPDEPCREPERRSRAVLKWKIYRRRPVTAAVRRPG